MIARDRKFIIALIIVFIIIALSVWGYTYWQDNLQKAEEKQAKARIVAENLAYEKRSSAIVRYADSLLEEAPVKAKIRADTPHIFKEPYPTYDDMEQAIGKADEHSEDFDGPKRVWKHPRFGSILVAHFDKQDGRLSHLQITGREKYENPRLTARFPGQFTLLTFRQVGRFNMDWKIERTIQYMPVH
jgi:hypothetical protein